MKTRKEHLKENLSEEDFKRFEKNLKDYYAALSIEKTTHIMNEVCSKDESLYVGFSWSNSPEGGKYWMDLFKEKFEK